jgi:hypothetical protein
VITQADHFVHDRWTIRDHLQCGISTLYQPVWTARTPYVNLCRDCSGLYQTAALQRWVLPPLLHEPSIFHAASCPCINGSTACQPLSTTPSLVDADDIPFFPCYNRQGSRLQKHHLQRRPWPQFKSGTSKNISAKPTSFVA